MELPFFLLLFPCCRFYFLLIPLTYIFLEPVPSGMLVAHLVIHFLFRLRSTTCGGLSMKPQPRRGLLNMPRVWVSLSACRVLSLKYLDIKVYWRGWSDILMTRFMWSVTCFLLILLYILSMRMKGMGVKGRPTMKLNLSRWVLESENWQARSQMYWDRSAEIGKVLM